MLSLHRENRLMVSRSNLQACRATDRAFSIHRPDIWECFNASVSPQRQLDELGSLSIILVSPCTFSGS